MILVTDCKKYVGKSSIIISIKINEINYMVICCIIISPTEPVYLKPQIILSLIRIR